MTTASYLTEKSWVPLGLAVTIGGGGFLTALWIMSTITGIGDDISKAAQAAKDGRTEIRTEIAELRARIDRAIDGDKDHFTYQEFENWTLRLQSENSGSLVVPRVQR